MLRHERLLVLLGLSPVSGEPLRGPRGHRHRAQPDACLFQRPRFRRAVRRGDRGSTRGIAGRHPRRLRDPLDPDEHERGKRRSGPVAVRTPTPRHGSRRRRPGRCHIVESRLLLSIGPSADAMARTRYQRPPPRVARSRHDLGRRRADRVHLRSHGGHLRPRHRGGSDRAGPRHGLRTGGDPRCPPRFRGDDPRTAPRTRRRRAG